MATYTETQKTKIILDNPNKGIVNKANEMRKRYSLHTHGVDYKNGIKKIDYVEDDACFGTRKIGAISNKDLFKRLLNKEDQIFTTVGGSAYYGLPKQDEDMMHGFTDNVINGLTLQKWVQTYALQAYRSDPMSVIFMEVDEVLSEDGQTFNTPKCYPTYKSSADIFDYLPNGRRLEHIVFKLTNAELLAYGIIGYEPTGTPNGDKYNQQYYRFVDDETDTIYKIEGNTTALVKMRQQNPIYHTFGKVPAFITSDLFQYDDPQVFGSPLQFVIELADCFFHDRSVRDLHKKLHGFPKAVEPLSKCMTCADPQTGDSTGLVGGMPCPSCTPIDGQLRSHGTGYKLKTTPADVMRFPLEMIFGAEGKGHMKVQDIFGYITPDIKGLDAMNISLVDQEQLMDATYWGTEPVRTEGFNGTQDINKTATSVLVDLQPIYARLNNTADWVEDCETNIANFIGEFWFPDTWKGANICLSRNYILELPDDILARYHEALKNGTPDATLDSLFKRYLAAVWKGNPDKMAVELKLFDLQPFPHQAIKDIELSPVIPTADKVAARYYGEWVNTLTDAQKMGMNKAKLQVSFKEYIALKTVDVTAEATAKADQEMKLKTATSAPAKTNPVAPKVKKVKAASKA